PRRVPRAVGPYLEYLEDRCLLNAGTLDLSFGAKGKVSTVFAGALNGVAQATALQSDGKIVAAGSANSASGTQFALARYQPDGSLDPTFGGGGQVLTNFGGSAFAGGVVIQPDGKIVAVGTSVGGTSPPRMAVARYNADGSLDPGFGSGGTFTTAF